MIYVSSKVIHAEMWQLLRRDRGVPINSSWIYDPTQFDLMNRNQCSKAWAKYVKEVREASCVLAYTTDGDKPLKGGLIEIGIAIGLGKLIFLVAESKDFSTDWMHNLGTWIHHDAVVKCFNLQDGIDLASQYDRHIFSHNPPLMREWK